MEASLETYYADAQCRADHSFECATSFASCSTSQIIGKTILTLPAINDGGSWFLHPTCCLPSLTYSSGQMSPSVSWLATGFRVPHGTFLENVECCVVVTIKYQLAVGTSVSSLL